MENLSEILSEQSFLTFECPLHIDNLAPLETTMRLPFVTLVQQSFTAKILYNNSL